MKTSKSKRLDDWIQKKLLPKVGKIGNQRHLASIRDGFALIIPLVIASAIGIIIRTSIFGGGGAGKSSVFGLIDEWTGGHGQVISPPAAGQPITATLAKMSFIMNFIFYSIEVGGLGSLAIFFAFSFGFFLAKTREDNDPIMGGFVSLATFFMMSASANGTATIDKVTGKVSWGGQPSFFSGGGLISAILFGMLAVEIYCKLSKSPKMHLKMPSGVPDAVSRSFAKLFPIILSLLCMVGVYALVALPTYYLNAKLPVVNENLQVRWVPPNAQFWTPTDLISAIIQVPLVNLASNESANLGIAIFYTFLVGLLWWFGVHGTNVANGIFQALWLILLANNATKGAHNIFVQGTFDGFIFFGGTETTLALVLLGLFMYKSPADKAIIRFAAPAGVFNINEPIVFGLPLVANLVYLVPVIFVMPTLTITTWIFFKIFAVSSVIVQIPWVTPIGIGGLLATSFDYKAFFVVLINFAIACAIWFPFVLIANKKYKTELDVKKAEGLEDEVVAAPVTRARFKFKTSKFCLLVLPTLFLSWFIISLGVTFGNSITGQVMAVIEGVAIAIAGLGIFFWPFLRNLFSKKSKIVPIKK